MPPPLSVTQLIGFGQHVQAAAAFDPDSIAGLAIWLKADAGVTITASPDVDSWTDQKNSYVFSQGTAAKKPHYVASAQNGLPGIDFDGTDDLLRHGADVLSGTTGCLFIAYIHDTVTGAGQTIFSSADEASTNRYWMLEAEETAVAPDSIAIAQINADADSRITSANVTLTSGDVRVVALQSDGTSYRFRNNGYDVVELEETVGDNDGDWFGDVTARDSFIVGALKRTSESNFFNGKVLEILVYDGVTLTSDEIRDVEGYLNDRWAIYTALSETPRGITGLEAWYEAASGIALNSTTVKAWADQSDNGNDLTQTTASAQPLYESTDTLFNNKPSVHWDGVNDYIKTAAFAGGALTQPITIVMVIRVDSISAARQYLFDDFDANDRVIATVESSSGGKWEMYATNFVAAENNDTNTNILLMVFNGASSKFYENGGTNSLAASDIGANTLGGITLGGKHDGSASFEYDGRMAEVFVYDGEPSDADKNTLCNELATKYGTTWTNIS